MSEKSISFKKARKFTRKLGLKSYTQWRKYCKSGNKPKGIPCEPSSVYKNNGWISYSNFLNYKGPSKTIFNRKYTINHDFFKVWSHDMAYILGFWWADGNMSKNKRHLTILVQDRDSYILKKFLKCMQSNYKIYTRISNNRTYKSIDIFSSEMAKDIIKIGGMPDKTKIIRFPKVPKKYLFDFIRGLWDGDGTIIKQKGKLSYISKITLANKNLILDIIAIFNKYNIKTKFYTYKDKYYTCRLNGKYTKLLFKKLHRNKSCIKLERKYELFKRHSKVYVPQRGENGFCSLNDARKFAKSKNTCSRAKWFDFCKNSKDFPDNIPKNPREVYKNEWNGWKNFLGTE